MNIYLPLEQHSFCSGGDPKHHFGDEEKFFEIVELLFLLLQRKIQWKMLLFRIFPVFHGGLPLSPYLQLILLHKLGAIRQRCGWIHNTHVFIEFMSSKSLVLPVYYLCSCARNGWNSIFVFRIGRCCVHFYGEPKSNICSTRNLLDQILEPTMIRVIQFEAIISGIRRE